MFNNEQDFRKAYPANKPLWKVDKKNKLVGDFVVAAGTTLGKFVDVSIYSALALAGYCSFGDAFEYDAKMRAWVDQENAYNNMPKEIAKNAKAPEMND